MMETGPNAQKLPKESEHPPQTLMPGTLRILSESHGMAL
jgi:hypothetical protein